MQRTPLLAAVLASLLVVLPAGAASALTVDRIAGTNQYETAIAVSQRLVTDPAESARTAVLVSGSDGADVLVAPVVSRDSYAGGIALNEFSPPVLMVPSGQGLPANVEAELRRLQLERLFIIGGTSKVSSSVERRARTFVPSVERIAGADRYATAQKVSQRWSPLGSRVFIVTGEANTEAVGALGAVMGYGPTLLLTAKSSLPAATAAELRRLRPTEVVVVGNTGVISSGVERAIRTTVPGANTVRVAGADRYATNLAVINYVQQDGLVNLVSGETWQNALVGAVYNGSQQAQAVLLLTRRGCVPPATADFAAAQGVDFVTVIGGTGNVSDAAANLTRC
jgi:putative cell wall-binding protein